MSGERKGDIEGTLTKYQLNLTYLLDASGSMFGQPINQLNTAMAESVQVAEETAKEKEVELRMRVVKFNNGAEWIYGGESSGESHIDWKPIDADGGTDTAEAIDLASSIMHRKYLGERNFKPVVILITDGCSNDRDDTRKAVDKLKTSLKSSTNPNKDKIIRIAIGVKGADQEELNYFASIGNIEREDGHVDENVPLVFDVENIATLKSLLKGITVSSIASSVNNGAGEDNTETPIIIEEDSNSSSTGSDEDVWEE